MVELGSLIKQAQTIRCGNGNYPVLSMTMRDGLVFQDEKFKKVIASSDKSDYKVVSRNQLVISFPIDEGVLATQRIVDAGIVSPAYGIWDINQEKVLPEFLECALRCRRALSYYKSKLRGSTARRRSLPTQELLTFNIPLPTIQEQTQILDVIHKLKEVISNRVLEIEQLDYLIKARFVEVFGDKGNVKVVKKTLGNICEFQQGTQIPVEKQYEEYVCGYERFLRIIDYTQPPQPPRYVSVVGKKVDEKSVVIVRYGATAGFVGRGYCGILANNLFEVIPDERVMSKDFLFLALKYGSFEMLIHDKVFGAAMPALSFSMMNDITIVVPNLTEQEIFTDFAAQIDKSKVVGLKIVS